MAKIKMTNGELYGLAIGCTQVGNLKGIKFAYAVAKTKNLIKPLVEALEEVKKPAENFQKFESERIKLCREHAEKDEKGQPKIMGGVYVGLGEEFNTELEKLKEEHKQAIEEREQQMQDYAKLLEEEVDVELHKVKLDEVPEDITGKQLEMLMPMIEE